MSWFVVAFTILAVVLACGGRQNGETMTTPPVPETARNTAGPVIAIEVEQDGNDLGTIYAELFPDVAPKTVEKILELVGSGFYDGLMFHRVIDGFMIQGGDPTGTGAGEVGFTLPAEFSKLTHARGALSMARKGHDVNSASSQFFICLVDLPRLDNQYTIFGRTVSGMEVVDAIGSTRTDAQDRPTAAVTMRRAYKVKDATGPVDVSDMMQSEQR
jgi:peptidyl-prolyl cis-trans isomerase B (cyclophilin B)